VLPQVAAKGLAEYADLFCEPHIFPVPLARVYARAAQRFGLKLRLHVDQLSRSGGAELAAELGAISADHLEHVGSKGFPR